jgi:hypothetical protein
MTISFKNKSELKKELVSGNYSNLYVRFGEDKKVLLPRMVLELIKNIAKTDRKFIKKLMSSEKDFMFFMEKISNISNK